MPSTYLKSFFLKVFMKKLFRIVAIATLTLLLSLSCHSLASVKVEQPIQNHSALSLVQEGKKFYDAGQYNEAIALLQQAARLYQTEGNFLKQAQVLSLLSLAQQRLGQWQKAETTIENSLSLLETLPQEPEQISIRAKVLNHKGHLQLARGQAEDAWETWQATETLYTQMGDDTGAMGARLNQAQALEMLGFYRRSCKTLLQAFAVEEGLCEDSIPTSLEQVLTTFKAQPNPLQLSGLQSLGNVLRVLGKLDEAQSVLKESLAIAKQLRSPQEESKALLALGNTQRALAYRARDLDKTNAAEKYALSASNYYQQAATLAKQSDRPLFVSALEAELNQLSLLVETRSPSDFETLFASIQTAIAELPISHNSVYLQVNLARSLTQLKQKRPENAFSWQEIANILASAVRSAQSLKDKRAESYALGYLAQLEYEHQLSASPIQAYLERALALAQSENMPEIAYRWQWQLGRIYRDRGENERAIATYQAAFDTLQLLRSDLLALNQEIQFSFREQVEPVYREFADLLLASKTGQPTQQHLKSARTAIEALQLAELDNYFQDACADSKENVEGVDPHAVIIYTAILPERLQVILSLPNGTLKLHTNAIAQREVEQTLIRLQQALREPDRLIEVQTLSRQVYRWLIEPFEGDLNAEASSIKTIAFVLDGILQNLPVAVLYDGKQYLLERYATAVTPGLRLFAVRKLARPFEALVAGVSEERRVGKQDFTALDNVKTEWMAIQSTIPSKALLNSSFTQSQFQQELDSRPFSVVHIATHGQFSSDPEDTFILLWDRVLNVKDLNSLLQTDRRSVREIVDLLVLSACETATGDRRASLGLAGVAVRAGARSTLATLWQINDESTAALMSGFYRKLSENPAIAKAEALRQAQLELWNNTSQDWQVPLFWAAYVLVGNWL
jgi:CHAT domain-containing protein